MLGCGQRLRQRHEHVLERFERGSWRPRQIDRGRRDCSSAADVDDADRRQLSETIELNRSAGPEDALPRLDVGECGTGEDEQPFRRRWICIRRVVLDIEATELTRSLKIADDDTFDAHDLVGKWRRGSSPLYSRDLMTRRNAAAARRGWRWRKSAVARIGSRGGKVRAVIVGIRRVGANRRGRVGKRWRWPGALEEVGIAVADEIDDMA